MAEPAESLPESGIGGAFRIAADGTWFHDGAPISRPRLVRLFARVLRREADGSFWLVTPVERVPVAVDDAPFVAVALRAEGTGRHQTLSFRTNVDAWVTLDAAHPLRIAAGPAGPKPYVGLGGGMEALIARSVYYDLANQAVHHAPGGCGSMEEVPGVWSAGVFFPLTPQPPRSGGGEHR